MTDNAKKVLSYLQEAGSGAKFTAKDVQTALGFEKVGAVVGTVSGLARKGRAEWITETVVDDEGKEKKVKYFSLTPDGLAFDPDAATE